MLPDALSVVHLIAGDSGHCEKQCSPSPCCTVITLAALILSPSPFLQFSTSLPYIPLFLPLSADLPLFLFPAHTVCCDLVLSVFTLKCRKQGNYNSNPSRVSLQIMTSDLCLYHVFSGTLFTSIANPSAQCSTTLPSSDGLIRWCLPKRARADYLQCLCRCLFM